MSDRRTPGSITVVEAGTEQLQAVIELSKRHQGTLGQLPFEAFRTFANDGRVLAAWSDDELAGYAIYRVRKRTGVVVLVHLCIDEHHRGRGHADRLLDHICERHPLAPGLAVWCREDYPAHSRWPSLGFHRTGSRPGRNRSGKQLIHWWRPISELTLFTFHAAIESVPAAAIDTNVFRDIVEPRLNFPESIALDDPWLIDSVELVITGQLHTEIEEASQTVHTLRGTTARFRRLAPPAAEWRPTFEELTSALSRTSIEPDDLRQLAEACAGEARYFVTRDGAVLANNDAIEAITGVQVLRPLDLALAMHADQYESTYRAEALRESELEIRHPAELPRTGDLVPFTDHDRGERSGDLMRALESVAPRLMEGGRLWELAPPGGAPIALAATSLDPTGVVVHGLRVRNDRDRVTFARQMLHRFREEAIAENVSAVRFAGSAPDYVEVALAAEGYAPDNGGWVARCERGVLGPQDVVPELAPAVPAIELTPEEISQVERVLWPLKIVTGRVPTYIVPIQPAWARALFGEEPRQPELLPRPGRLGLAREHVYYRSFTRQVEAPARLLWWVSGSGDNGGMRAVSWLEEAVSARPRTLYRRFGTQGIYTEPDVESLVKHKGGLALALVFSRTETFRNHIPLALARELFPPIGGNGYLQTSRRVGEHVFADFYKIGTAPR